MLNYSEENRQRIITRLSLMNRATDVLPKEITGAANIRDAVKWMTNELEKAILDAPVTQ